MSGTNIVKNYSIHNLINIKINTQKKLFGQNVFNNPLSYFEVENMEDYEVDINLKIGKFKPGLEHKFIVDHKYYLDKNYLYLEDQEKSSSWKLEIKGLNEDKIEINFEGKLNKIYGLFFPDVLAFEIVLKPILELMLASKGYFLAHAGAISKNNKPLLLFGMAGSLKSSIILNGIKQEYLSFGDDKVILDINNNLIYNFPIYHQLLDYTVNVGKEELTKIQKLKFFSSSFKNNPPADFWESEPIKFDKAFILERKNSIDTIEINKLENEEAIKKIISNNKNEFYVSLIPSIVSKNSFPDYLLAYSYIFPESELADYWITLENQLKDDLNNLTFYMLEIPEKYDENTIYEILKSLGDYQ